MKTKGIRFTFMALVCLLLMSHFGFLIYAQDGVIPMPAHPRPYFMPEWKRQEIRKLISEEPWAKTEYERIKKAVLEVHSLPGKYKSAQSQEEERTGFWAAFLYALEGLCAKQM